MSDPPCSFSIADDIVSIFIPGMSLPEMQMFQRPLWWLSFAKLCHGIKYVTEYPLTTKGETITRVNGNVSCFAGKRLQNF